MEVFLSIVQRLSKYMQWIAGAALIFIMLLTVADVALRLFGRPIVGTYEMVGLGGAVVIGFALPVTSLLRCHIFVDFFIQNLSAFRKGPSMSARGRSLSVFLCLSAITFWRMPSNSIIRAR